MGKPWEMYLQRRMQQMMEIENCKIPEGPVYISQACFKIFFKHHVASFESDIKACGVACGANHCFS